MEKINFVNGTAPALNATNLNQMQDNIEVSINNLDNTINTKQKILWTNSKPDQAFETQEITLNSDDYDVLEIFFKQAYNNNTIIIAKAIKGNKIVGLNLSVPSTGYACNIERRDISYISDTKLSVGNCYAKRSNVTTDRETYNSGLIPLYVIGHKTGLFN